MRNWSLWTGKDEVSLHLEEGSWWSWWLEGFICTVCSHFPCIPLPPIPMKNDDGEETNWRDWWGDTNSLFHCYVCMPVCQFCWDHQKDVESIAMSYEDAILSFGDRVNRPISDDEDD